MEHLNQPALMVFASIVFGASAFLHLTKKSASAIHLYMAQSSAIAVLLLFSALDRFSVLLVVAIVATVAVKIVIAPYFFYRLTQKTGIVFSAGSYLSAPLTLLAIAALVAITQSRFFTALALLARPDDWLLQLAFGTILVSILLSINRKGALSQILGILSLENGIVAFAMFAGLEQSPGFQLGITFNIFVWVVIATVFAAMIFRQFGSLDVTKMRKLKD